MPQNLHFLIRSGSRLEFLLFADSVLHIAATCSNGHHHMTEGQEDREESVPAEQEVGLLKEELNLA